MRAILLSLLLMFTSFSFAEESKTKLNIDKRKLMNIGIIVGSYGGFAGLISLGSRDPKTLGRVWLTMSPLMAGFAADSPSATLTSSVVVGSAFVGWGLYNINDLDKGDYSEGEIFRRNMAIPVGAIVLGSGANWLLKKAKPDTQSQIDVTPLADGAVLSLSSRF